MKYFSLFSGIGGFELGIGSKAECVGFSEIDKYATQIYLSHFPNHHAFGDITTINADELPDFDLLCGGFPCQAFSVAGKRRGFDDTRGTLFFDICRLAKAKRPRLLLLENVKGLLNHDGGQTFRVILASLDELGYDCQWQVCNSKDFGVPQNRERVIIVGHLRGTPRPQVFPITPTDRAYSQELSSTTVDANYWKGIDNHGARTAIVHRQPLRYLNRNQKNYDGDYAFTVDSSQTAGVRTGIQIRRLTPTECERLQGFPDGWTAGVSDTQRYKTLGNAVTVNVIEAVASKLLVYK